MTAGPVPAHDADPLAAALTYAARGLRVLPILPGAKRPPMAAWAWCDHCGWRADHHPDDPPIGRAVTRIVNTTTNTKETTP